MRGNFWGGAIRTLTPSHPHTLTPSHPHTLTPSHPHTLTPLFFPMPSDTPPGPDLPARLAALEARVAALEAARDASARARPVGRVFPPPLRRLPGVRWAEVESEDVLGKVGIALLLVGVLFLLKYTIDRELLTPAVRVGGAAAVGAALVVVGQRLRAQRRALGRIMAGGGVAALYGSVWTASALYPLLPPAVGLAGMAAVAALSLALAVREEDAALSVVGTLGALMTPLLLYRDPGQMALLTAYTALVVGGAAWVYARQGWPALAGAGAAGGWAVLLVASLVGVHTAAATGADRVLFTIGVLVVWAATGLLPVWHLRRASAARAPGEAAPTLLRPEPLAVLVAPALAFGFLGAAWSWAGGPAAAVAVVLGAAYVGAAWRLRAVPALFEPLVLAAAALGAWGAARWFGALDARALGVAVALACAVVGAARRERVAELRRLGHGAALALAALVLAELFLAVGAPWGRLQALDGAGAARETMGALIAAGALAAVGFTSVRGSTARYAYLTAAHLTVLLLVRVLLRPEGQGAALVSTAWSVYAVALVAVGLRLHDDVLRQIGLGTLLATVAKVLLFDLSAIPTLWRVLLFMGLGGLLLLVSYFVPSLLRGRAAPAAVGGDGAAATPGGGSP